MLTDIEAQRLMVLERLTVRLTDMDREPETDFENLLRLFDPDLLTDRLAHMDIESEPETLSDHLLLVLEPDRLTDRLRHIDMESERVRLRLRDIDRDWHIDADRETHALADLDMHMLLERDLLTLRLALRERHWERLLDADLLALSVGIVAPL